MADMVTYLTSGFHHFIGICWDLCWWYVAFDSAATIMAVVRGATIGKDPEKQISSKWLCTHAPFTLISSSIPVRSVASSVMRSSRSDRSDSPTKLPGSA